MKHLMSFLGLLCLAGICSAQANYYEVTAGDGYGLRFWGSGYDHWKIHMGNSGEYHYGPVYDYSIKTNMDAQAGRGWTWGTAGATPVAALSNVGNMQIAGTFGARNANVGTGTSPGSLNVIAPVATAFSYDGFSVTDYTSSTMTIRSLGSGVMHLSTDLNSRKLVLGGGYFEQTMSIATGGNVGIGTLTPTTRLEVVGSGSVINVSNYSDQDFGVTLSAPGAATKRTILGTSQPTRLSLGVGVNNESLTVVNGGNVGIGTTVPVQKLTVNGTVHATRVKVETTVPGPDYVFEKDYALPSLDQIKSYIDENKHLPEVPSAKEMEAKGIDVGEMNMLLLKKVEELTLYVIDLKEEMKQKDIQMQAQINELSKK
jgi:hypothetical protein